MQINSSLSFGSRYLLKVTQKTPKDAWMKSQIVSEQLKDMLDCGKLGAHNTHFYTGAERCLFISGNKDYYCYSNAVRNHYENKGIKHTTLDEKGNEDFVKDGGQIINMDPDIPLNKQIKVTKTDKEYIIDTVNS